MSFSFVTQRKESKQLRDPGTQTNDKAIASRGHYPQLCRRLEDVRAGFLVLFLEQLLYFSYEWRGELLKYAFLFQFNSFIAHRAENW